MPDAWPAALPALLPLAGALLAAYLPRRAAAACALLAAAAALAAVAFAANRLGFGAAATDWLVGPAPAAPLQVGYRLDALTVFASLAACATALAVFLLRLPSPRGEGEDQLEVWGLTLLAGVLVAVWASDLPLVALGWGIAWGGAMMLAARSPGYPEGAGGALIATGGVVALLITAAALRLAGAPAEGRWVLPWAALTLAGIAALGAFPLQAWSRPGLGGLVQGLVGGALSLSLGPYLLARGLARVPLETAWPAELLLLPASLCFVIGALDALRARQLRRLLAAVALVQAGFVLLGFGVRSPQAVTGALLLALTAGPALAVLAYAGAWIERQQGVYGSPLGAAAELRRAAFLYTGAAIALCGVPAAAGPFVAKWIITTAAVETGWAIFAGLGIVAGGLLTAAIAQAAAAALLGDWRYRGLTDLDGRQTAAAFLALLPVILTGLLPWLPLRGVVEAAAAAATGVSNLHWTLGLAGTGARAGLPVAALTLLLLAAAAVLAIAYVYEGVGDLLGAFLRQGVRPETPRPEDPSERRPTRADLWLDTADSGAWLGALWRAFAGLARGLYGFSHLVGERYYMIAVLLLAILMLFLWRT
jgi:formate hydrogenlyase subunit 3/multisubunit Na+/H+ antiporter MnhD subunit